MALCPCPHKELRNGMKYHYSLLYNVHEGQADRRQGDTLLAWNFLTELNQKLSIHGYNSVMYGDKALPGSNIFDNLFNMINESEKIVVLLTPEFITNGWNKYATHAAIKNLFDKHASVSKLIPIAINIPKERIPEHFGFSVSTILFTKYLDQSENDDPWDQILAAIGRTELHYEQNGNLYSEACFLSASPTENEIRHAELERNLSRDVTDQSVISGDGYVADSETTTSVHPATSSNVSGDNPPKSSQPTENEIRQAELERNLSRDVTDQSSISGYGYEADSESSTSVHSAMSNIMRSMMVKSRDRETSKRLEGDYSPRPQSDSSSNVSGDNPPKSSPPAEIEIPHAELARDLSSLEIDGSEDTTDQFHISDDGHKPDSDKTESVHSPMSDVRCRNIGRETSKMVCTPDLEQTQRLEGDGAPSDSRKGIHQSDSSSNVSGDSPPKSLIHRIASRFWGKIMVLCFLLFIFYIIYKDLM